MKKLRFYRREKGCPLSFGYREVIWGKTGLRSAREKSRYADVRRELLVCWPPRGGHTWTHIHPHAYNAQ